MVVATSLASVEDWFVDRGLPILIIVVVAVVLTIVARLLARRFRHRLEGEPRLTQALDVQRAATLANALSATSIVAIWVTASFLILGRFEVNLAPLLASAGIVGVALGFGAQNIVGDTLAGFFVLLENQYGVGDTVDLQTTEVRVRGRVEDVTLRVVSVRSFDGTLHVVPHGKVVVASNRSRGWARAIVDVPVAYDENVAEIRGILDELFDELREDESFREWIHEGPSVLGIEGLAGAQQVRVTAETRPSKRLETERVLRERVTGRLVERGVKVVPPAPPAPAPPAPPA